MGARIGFGIGIAHGFATLGTIGFEGRFDYAAIGTVSNVASRLCDEAKPGQILIARGADEGRERRQGRAGRRVRVEGDSAASGGLQCGRRGFGRRLRSIEPRSRPKEARCPAVTLPELHWRVSPPLGYHPSGRGAEQIHGLL